MEEGLHESLLTTELEHQLARELVMSGELAKIDDADQVHAITRHVAEAVRRRLEAIRDPADRLAFTNDLLEHVDAATQSLVDPLRELQSLRYPPGPGVTTRYASRPRTPLNDAALLTNAHGEPSLASELRAEFDSADAVDLLCAFVMWRGVRLLERELSAMKDAGGSFSSRHDDLHRRHRARGPRPARPRLRRRGEGAVRRRAHAPTRQGVALSPRHRLRHGVRRLLEPLNRALLDGVEWNVRLSNSATPSSDAEVQGHLRLLLEQP